VGYTYFNFKLPVYIFGVVGHGGPNKNFAFLSYKQESDSKVPTW